MDTSLQEWGPDRLREFPRRVYEAWNSYDADRLLAFWTEDIAFADPTIPGGSLHGKEAARDWVEAIWRAAPDIAFEAVGEPFLSVDGMRLATGWRCEGHFTGPGIDPPGWAPTNDIFKFEGIEIFEFEGDLVCDDTVFFDATVFAQQVDALPAPGSLSMRVGVLMQHLAARHRRRAVQRQGKNVSLTASTTGSGRP